MRITIRTAWGTREPFSTTSRVGAVDNVVHGPGMCVQRGVDETDTALAGLETLAVDESDDGVVGEGADAIAYSSCSTRLARLISSTKRREWVLSFKDVRVCMRVLTRLS